MIIIPHPSVLICIWVLLALIAQRLQELPLFLLCFGLFLIGFGLCAKQLLSLLRRTRWIMFSLILVYAYSTPGIAVWPKLGLLSPTIDGLLDGAMQLGRLLSVLAGLGVLMTVLSLSQLISGIYSLMYPLRWLGLPRERFAVRLALTLENAESAMRDTASDWKYTIGDALKLSAPIISPIEIRQQRIKAFDVVLFAFGIIVTVGLWR